MAALPDTSVGSPVLECGNPPSQPGYRSTLSLIGWGMFITTFAQTLVIGKLPLQILLKDKLLLGAEAVSVFMNFNGRFHLPNGTLSAISFGFALPCQLWQSLQLRPFCGLFT